ncbi:MAG: ATPase [Methanocellales archaeon]|nr:ATPase [Methanocellales archaeon]
MIPVEIGLGLAIMGAGIAMGMSAIAQGIAAAGAVGATAERPEIFGKGLVFSVLPETQAIYGLLIAILILAGIGLLG